MATNQDAVIAQQLAERMPEIVRAAAEPFAHVGQMTVLNGAEGVNSMLGSIIAQVGTLLPQLTSALGRQQTPKPNQNGSRPLPLPQPDAPNAARNQQ